MSTAIPTEYGGWRADRAFAHGRPGVFNAAIGGAVAGFIAGIAVALAAMSYSAIATPEEFWLPMKNVGATWLGVNALIGTAGVVATGLSTHLAVSAGWGAAFALIVSRVRSPALILLAGLLYSGVVWVVMTLGFMPWLNPTMTARIAANPHWWWWTLHLIFGVVLAASLLAVTEPAAVESRHESRHDSA